MHDSRVSAVNSVFIGASNELGEFESGFTAAWVGLVPAIVLGGGGRWARLVPPPARPALWRPDRGGAARHPRDSGIEGARSPLFRLHVQRHQIGRESCRERG